MSVSICDHRSLLARKVLLVIQKNQPVKKLYTIQSIYDCSSPVQASGLMEGWGEGGGEGGPGPSSCPRITEQMKIF